MMRSLLYVPANNPRFIAKAHERGADAIILDLEDAVPVAEKDAARAGLAEAVQAVAKSGAKVFVRINPEPERQHLDAEAACRAGADGLYVAKATTPDTFVALAALLHPVEVPLRREPMTMVALLEDPGAVLDARLIARAPRVIGLSAGGEDIALALGGTPTPEVLRFPKLLIHYAAKAEGLLSFGLLRSSADYADHTAIIAAVAEAREHGFDGASCVHPALVPLLNQGFSPSAEELDWARRVVAAAETSGGAFTVDGRMVDAPVIARARRLLGL